MNNIAYLLFILASNGADMNLVAESIIVSFLFIFLFVRLIAFIAGKVIK